MRVQDSSGLFRWFVPLSSSRVAGQIGVWEVTDLNGVEPKEPGWHQSPVITAPAHYWDGESDSPLAP
jgi:hypothetical protein